MGGGGRHRRGARAGAGRLADRHGRLWRAIFLLNIPVAAGALALAWLFAPAVRDKQTTPLDVWGGLLATVGLGVVTWGLTLGSSKDSWTEPAVIAALAGLAMLAGFVLIEKAMGDKAMMPLALFGSSTYVGLTLLTFALYGALGGPVGAGPLCADRRASLLRGGGGRGPPALSLDPRGLVAGDRRGGRQDRLALAPDPGSPSASQSASS